MSNADINDFCEAVKRTTIEVSTLGMGEEMPLHNQETSTSQVTSKDQSMLAKFISHMELCIKNANEADSLTVVIVKYLSALAYINHLLIKMKSGQKVNLDLAVTNLMKRVQADHRSTGSLLFKKVNSLIKTNIKDIGNPDYFRGFRDGFGTVFINMVAKPNMLELLGRFAKKYDALPGSSSGMAGQLKLTAGVSNELARVPAPRRLAPKM